MTKALNPVSQPYLPKSVASALENDTPEHPDIPWSLPAKIPPINDLKAALQTLEARMRPADDTLMGACFAKLVAIFEPPGTKLTGPELRLRLEVWREVTKDIPADLFQTGIEACCASLKWMPKPVEVREMIGEQLDRRTKAIRRIKQMIEAADRPVGAFVREPWDVRVRGMRDSYRKIGNFAKAQAYEDQLAAYEGRPVIDQETGQEDGPVFE